MSTKTRIKKIEQAQGTSENKKYICFITNGMFGDEDEGYKVQALPVSQGGTGGDNIHFKTRAELDKFAARSDSELRIVEFVYSDKAIDA